MTISPIFRAFIRKPLIELAKENPEVEILVRKVKQGKAAVLRGHYGSLKNYKKKTQHWNSSLNICVSISDLLDLFFSFAKIPTSSQSTAVTRSFV